MFGAEKYFFKWNFISTYFYHRHVQTPAMQKMFSTKAKYACAKISLFY